MTTKEYISPTGEIARVPEQDAERAVKLGWTPATKQEVAEVEYGGLKGQAIAGVGGVARGLTVGLSDAALRGLAPGAADYLRGVTEANPVTAIGGEIVGTGAGMLVGSGEAGLLGRAASLPTRLVTRAGETAARVADSAIIHGAIRAGTEGALYGAGAAVSEAALGDDYSHIGESLVANAGLGAVAGVGISSILEHAVPAGARRLGATLGREAAGGEASAVTGTLREKLGTKLEGLLPSTPETKLAGQLKRGERTLIDADARSREVAKLADSIYDDERFMRKGMFGDSKIKQIDSLVDHENWAQALEVTSKAYGEASQVQAMLESVADKGGAGVSVHKMSKSLERLGKVIDGIEAVAESKRSLELFTALDRFKRDVGKAADYGKRFPSTEAAKEYNALYQGTDESVGIRRALEHDAWGRAADAQREINQVVSDKLTLQREFDEHFATQHGSADGYVLDRFDPGTYKSLLTDITGAQHDLKWQAFNHVLDGSASQSDMALKHYAWSDSEIARLESIKEKTAKLRKMVAEDKAYSDELKALELARAAEQDPGLIGAGMRAIWPIGPVLGGVADMLSKPIARAEMIAKIKGRVESATARVERALDKQLSGKLVEPKRLKAKDITPEAIDRMVAPVSEHAPNVGMAMTATATRAMTFLRSKRPRSKPDTGINDREYASNGSEAKYARYAEATVDPIGTLEKPLTKEHMEAYEEVYPTWLKNVRGIALEKAHEKKSLSHSDKVNLGVLLGTPVNWSTEPNFVAGVQAAYSQQEQAAPQGRGGGRPIKLQSIASRSDRIEAR